MGLRVFESFYGGNSQVDQGEVGCCHGQPRTSYSRQHNGHPEIDLFFNGSLGDIDVELCDHKRVGRLAGLFKRLLIASWSWKI